MDGTRERETCVVVLSACLLACVRAALPLGRRDAGERGGRQRLPTGFTKSPFPPRAGTPSEDGRVDVKGGKQINSEINWLGKRNLEGLLWGGGRVRWTEQG